MSESRNFFREGYLLKPLDPRYGWGDYALANVVGMAPGSAGYMNKVNSEDAKKHRDGVAARKADESRNR